MLERYPVGMNQDKNKFNPGDVISYMEMCQFEGQPLQRGMNYRVRGKNTVILMSLRKGAPYADRIEDGGKVLIYEGHDISKAKGILDPKKYDQPMRHRGGTFTANGHFFEAAKSYHEKRIEKPELIRVYEKIKDGIWVFNGVFDLADAWTEKANGRNVFKFKLLVTDEADVVTKDRYADLEHNRMIPTSVKLAVWRRDHGQCTQCGSADNLHFDHIIPYSKGGSSLVEDNIQILCARHNLGKSDKII